jgi:LuxR family maltose regulon positive regulatory protein
MEYNMPILPVKLKMPQPRKNYIIRQNLYQLLEKYEEYKVAIVKAGAGCGKTTLLSSFIIEKGIDNVRWITLDEYMNQAFVFWNYMIESVKDYLEDSNSNFQNFFDSNIQKENLWQILSLLLSKLNMNQDLLLILDDFQIITDEFLISTINYFIENMPDNLHIIFLTRDMPELYFGGLAIENKLLVIDEEEFILNEKESREFLLKTLKLNKEEEQISSMIEGSEGWIGGLQLLAISSKDKNGLTMESLKVSTRVLNDYITKEIFTFLSEEEQEFLIETSILRYFNDKICEKYNKDINFISMIQSILQKNLFVINIDESAGIYRYHAILGEYLKGMFDKLSSDKKMKLHNLAASIYTEIGDYEESLHHLFCNNEYEKIIDLILKMPQTAMTYSYMMKVPMEEIIKKPDFAYQYYFYYYANVDEEACKKIYQYIKNNMKEDETFKAFKRANLFFSDDWDLRNVNTLSIEQIKELKLNPITTAFLLIKEAYFHYANSRYREAIDCLNDAEEVYKDSDNIYIGFFVLSEKAQIYEDMGELSLCLNLYKQMEPMILQVKSLACSYYIGIAGVYIRQLALDKAFEMLQNVGKYIKTDSVNMDRAYQYTLAEYYYLTGDNDMTEKLLIDVMGQEIYQNIYYSARLLRYPFYRGEHQDFTKQFISQYEAADDIMENMDCDLLYVSIQYETGHYSKALELVECLIAKARKMQNKLKIVEGDLLKLRMLLTNQGDKRIIKNLFVEAVSYATEDKIANPFWFEKNSVNQVLLIMNAELKKELSKEEYEFVTCIMSADTKSGISQIIKDKADNTDGLTEREMEVLNELASGSTNMQIAEKLCISLATVKSHINNIYGKLGVNNRVAAINKFKH